MRVGLKMGVCLQNVKTTFILISLNSYINSYSYINSTHLIALVSIAFFLLFFFSLVRFDGLPQVLLGTLYHLLPKKRVTKI